jgi:hypothetical protein
MIKISATRALTLMLLTAATTSISTSAVASNPCSADIEAFCPEVAPGGGRLSSCLGEEHIDQISEGCRKHLKRTLLRTQLFDVDDACLEAAQRLCFDAVLLGGDFEECLSERAAELPQDCRKDIDL